MILLVIFILILIGLFFLIILGEIGLIPDRTLLLLGIVLGIPLFGIIIGTVVTEIKQHGLDAFIPASLRKQNKPYIEPEYVRKEKAQKERIEQLQYIQENLWTEFMSGAKFEEVCTYLLRAAGYDARQTPVSGDHGADIIAKGKDDTYAIQCKCFSQPVGNRAVQEAYAGKGYYGTTKAAVLTNNDFTPQAIEDAKKLGVELWNYKVLSFLLHNVLDAEAEKNEQHQKQEAQEEP